jgi:hypothetical protein
MDGIIWVCSALIFALGAVGILSGIRRRSASVEQNRGRCSNCETPMSLRRVSWFKSHLWFGEWQCPHCGTRIRSGKGISRSAA